ncbi:MAG: hypothetical protein AAFN18_23325 [Cyanobacteria bacterium J06554_6]
MYSLQARRRQGKQRTAQIMIGLAGGAIATLTTWVVLFATGTVTLGGVPYSVLMKFWQDAEARDAYFSGDSRELHDRLGRLGIEYEIKEYYRDRISDPVKLDQHIHQILYDRTRYLGENYTVKGGKLVLKTGRSGEIESCPNC